MGMSKSNTDWLFWRAGQSSTEWEIECGRELSHLLGPLIATSASDDIFQVVLDLPTADAAKAAFAANMDLTGSVSISLAKLGAASLVLSVPLPFHGVFIRRSADAARAISYVWCPWLGEAPGFRYIRPTSKASRDLVFWRMGLPGGYYFQAPCGALNSELASEALPELMPWLSKESLYPDWIQDTISKHSLFLSIKSPAKAVAFWNEIHTSAAKYFHDGTARVTGEDNLNHRALMTVPVWMKFHLCDLLIRRIRADKQFIMATNDLGRDEAFTRTWKKISGETSVLEQRLVPFKALVHSGRLHQCDPLNPVDMASMLTQLSRSGANRDVLEMLPAEYRQNHPTFRGRICPVQTPESALVGLSLHLARGATISPNGLIHPATGGTDPSAELGISAGLIPFYQHNDCTRSMMGAKNLSQALPVRGRKSPLVKTGNEENVNILVQPLITCNVCPSATNDDGEMALGADILVAHMPWMGLNFEDAIVAGEQLVKSGIFDVAYEERILKRFKPGQVPCGSLRNTSFKEEIDGLAEEGATLHAGSLIASFRQEGDYTEEPFEIRYMDHSPAQLKSILFKRGAPWMGGVLEYVLVKHIPLRLGDKLMGRHGNKGVIGAILSPNQMPRLPDVRHLPPAMRGRPIDIILNPHSVISRMNVGQLLETHVGWLLHSGIIEKDFASMDAGALGQAFSIALDHSKIKTLLKKTGLSSEGKINLDLPSGQTTSSPIVVGFQHIVRLRHIPELKAQARRGGDGARYSRKTGQAVHGRALGGGQRLGEMEIWALAAHSAGHLLAESLGIRADAHLSRKWSDTKDGALSSNVPAGFGERMRDWLRALLIDLDVSDSIGKLSMLSADSALDLIGPTREVRSPQGLRKMISARFYCDRIRQGFSCGFSVLDGEPISVEGGNAFGPKTTLTFGALLDHLNLRPAGPLQVMKDSFILPLLDSQNGKPTGSVTIQIQCKKDQVKAIMQPSEEEERPKRWPKVLEEVHLYGRFSKSKGVNASAEEVVAAYTKTDGQWKVTDMRITCPHHKTIPVLAHPPYRDVYSGAPNSLYDSRLFGMLHTAGHEDGPPGWGFIRLPVDIEYPAEIFLGKNWEKILKANGRSKSDLPTIRILPILPLRYRMPYLAKSVPLEDELIREGYRKILNDIARYNAAGSDDSRRFVTEDLNTHLHSLFECLVGALIGKKGLIRQCGLGRCVDRSARLVITPNPDLDWDQVGLPTSVLLELCGDDIGCWLDKKKESPDLFDRIAAYGFKESSLKTLADWRWMNSDKDEFVLDGAYEIVKEFFKEHPGKIVLLNRQPSLHRDSFQAFHPLPLPPSAGDIIQLCPLVCKGFGADFDGDEMVVHIPLSAAAQEEATRLLPSRNILSLATGDVMANFDQDVVLGTYWLTRDQGELNLKFEGLFKNECCQKQIAADPMLKGQTAKLLAHLAQSHPENAPKIICEWMRLAFECCTQMGVSFGFYDLLDLHARIGNLKDEIEQALDEDNPSNVNEVVQERIERILSERLGQNDFSVPGLQFAAMALSGARGRDQSRQLIGSRGFLSPGAIIFEAPVSRFMFHESLVEGMSSEAAFFSAMNSRSSMCDKKLGTRQAGHLTRRLVTALWHCCISGQDCGSKDANRNILTCVAKSGCCAVCYGRLPNGASAPIGFPAGLIAAQSIGERGTQLSMQSFHTGQKAFSIHDVLDILDSRKKPNLFDRIESAPIFIGEMKQSSAYRSLRDCHFRILWRVIHDSPDKSLRSAIKSLGLFARIVFENQAKHLFLGALLQEQGMINQPPANVLFNRFILDQEPTKKAQV
jgi:hypothetical protein